MSELSKAARESLGQYRSGLERPADDDAALLAQIEASIEDGYVPPVLGETPAPALDWGHRLRWAAVGAAAAAVVLGVGLTLSGVSLSGNDATAHPEAAGYNASSSAPEEEARAAVQPNAAKPNAEPTDALPSEAPVEMEPAPTDPAPASAVDAPKAERRPRKPNPATKPGNPAAPSSAPQEAPTAMPDALAQELKLMQRARRAIDAGTPKAALSILAEHRRRFSSGQLREDRMALRVVALCASGNNTTGAREANAFARAFPKSHHLGRVRSSCKK